MRGVIALALALLASSGAALATDVDNMGKEFVVGFLPNPLNPPPAIELASGGNVTSASYDLHFTVRSRSPLRSINVKHNRQPVEFAPDLAAIQPDGSGAYVYAGTLPVQLMTGDNRFEILAANDGGAEAQADNHRAGGPGMATQDASGCRDAAGPDREAIGVGIAAERVRRAR